MVSANLEKYLKIKNLLVENLNSIEKLEIQILSLNSQAYVDMLITVISEQNKILVKLLKNYVSLVKFNDSLKNMSLEYTKLINLILIEFKNLNEFCENRQKNISNNNKIYNDFRLRNSLVVGRVIEQINNLKQNLNLIENYL